MSTERATPPTLAEQVWAECERGAAHVAVEQPLHPWSTRDIIIAAVDSFAAEWDTVFGPCSVHDPNAVKELARWIRKYLLVAGRVPEGR